MTTRMMARVVAALVIAFPSLVGPAYADNPMGYRLLSQEEAAGLPRNQGALGLDVERAQQVTDSGLTFDIIRVKQVKPGSAGARSGFRMGDQIIAVDGRVFPTLAVFAAYIGSKPSGSQVSVDYIPTGGGPQQAQRVAVGIGTPNEKPQAQAGQTDAPAPSGGMSTGTKVAIGVGAAALFGCYELGCFSHRSTTAPSNGGRPPVQQQPGALPQR